MIEEIKKEIHDEVIFNNIANEHKGYIKEKKVFEILDKYKDKEDKYKKAWEELKNKTNEELKQATWAAAGLNDTKISMQELEQKYNLGGE